MDKISVEFIIRMVFSEMQELALTVCDSPLESILLLQKCMGTIDISKELSNGIVGTISDQIDAMVDAYYYMLDTAGKHGMNLSKVFQIVHAANMAKRHKDGKFHRRNDGKIMKPPGWTTPNIKKEIIRQTEMGSFSK
jgi:predicted HAD superfamily Cof-like phosphohydrolase